MSDEKGHECAEGDVMALGPKVNGAHTFIRHHADHRVEHGLIDIRPMEEGRPVPENAVLLQSRKDSHLLDVVPVCDRNGPVKVNSNAFKHGWDTIFGKTPIGEA